MVVPGQVFFARTNNFQSMQKEKNKNYQTKCVTRNIFMNIMLIVIRMEFVTWR